MQETLGNFQTSVPIGGRPICNLRFADIDLMAGTETELQELTTKLKNFIKKFWMEINIDKSKILVNSHNNHTPTNITMGTRVYALGKVRNVTSPVSNGR
jgi:hypothetical protein